MSLCEPSAVFKSKGGRVFIEQNGVKRSYLSGNPAAELKKLVSKRRRLQKGLPFPFTGGAVGYFSYDFARHFEILPLRARKDSEVFDSYFIFCDDFIVYDSKNDEAFIVASRPSDYLPLVARPEVKGPGALRASKPSSNFSKKKFEAMVKRAKGYISSGDAYQVNLAQRYSCTFKGSVPALYEKLIKLNPSPYSFYFNTPEISLVSCSPELLFSKRGALAQTRPIAGTRPRGDSLKTDKKISGELLLDPKERAEHIMLVDLERNDMGRVCAPKSIKVNERMVLEKYSHVIHIVSNIKGKLRKNKDAFDVLRALFPGGTITGCPKIRSMEIIEELENLRRGPYCGSAGWLGYNGDAQLNILIRTIILRPQRGRHGFKADFYAGAGIVADSVPSREYEETVHKARAMAHALGVTI
ncbi:MAG: hypothetical protein A2339_05700 [Elusimicrobia bacterium RIFOXYB12_FULL_50_12]|nr:MAG: hypothetical protein A2278_08700 [Elusimicrobia bacterium RIFOXYA12_FULL_49_49]OGS14837.1 MAG: hypothetical protein A2251_09895 [Elusimicrobia bacterium RIFOXYA2_FULL_47_53]OGS25759.1 MAG: hypothetical protein A2339_05700 [Elusimicrobia bacterium RIFOXYB12_FULL_50_12]OGS28967.1 MAG: hypothetical protein A2323_05130 [Elusimicrobia bacterium RIFOXYB2_FULL_46_23]